MAKPKFHWSLNPEWKKKAIAKIKKARAKQPPTNLGREWSDSFKTKVSDGVKRAYKEGRLEPYAHWTGKKMPKSVCQKMSESAKKAENSGRFKKGSQINLGRIRLDMRGPNNSNWRGGTTSETIKRVTDPKWRTLAKTIYKRDYWRCRICGIYCRDKIQCHHVKPVREGGTDESDNLVTLDRAHHLKIERSKFQDFWTQYFKMGIKVSPN